MKELKLRENEATIVDHLDDDVGDALVASGLVQASRIEGGRWEVQPAKKQKVGVASIAGLNVIIRPKLPIRRVMFMLGYAKNPHWRDDDLVGLDDDDGLVPVMAHLFAKQADRALEGGPLRGYVESTDYLTVLRGRLRNDDQLRRRFSIGLPLEVTFDDHTVDIPENRYLRTAAEALLKLPRVKHETLARLRRIRRMLIDVTTYTPECPPEPWFPTRLNRRYHDALGLAELVVAGRSVDHRLGGVLAGGFLVSMWKVYEDFVTVAFTEALRPYGGTCQPQACRHLDVAGDVELKPDLVWRRPDGAVVVMDAKYMNKGGKRPPRDDLFQTFTYCMGFRAADAHLIYAEGQFSRTRHEMDMGVSIHTHTLNLDADRAELLAQVDVIAGRIAATSSSTAA